MKICLATFGVIRFALLVLMILEPVAWSESARWSCNTHGLTHCEYYLSETTAGKAGEIVGRASRIVARELNRRDNLRGAEVLMSPNSIEVGRSGVIYFYPENDQVREWMIQALTILDKQPTDASLRKVPRISWKATFLKLTEESASQRKFDFLSSFRPVAEVDRKRYQVANGAAQLTIGDMKLNSWLAEMNLSKSSHTHGALKIFEGEVATGERVTNGTQSNPVWEVSTTNNYSFRERADFGSRFSFQPEIVDDNGSVWIRISNATFDWTLPQGLTTAESKQMQTLARQLAVSQATLWLRPGEMAQLNIEKEFNFDRNEGEGVIFYDKARGSVTTHFLVLLSVDLVEEVVPNPDCEPLRPEVSKPSNIHDSASDLTVKGSFDNMRVSLCNSANSHMRIPRIVLRGSSVSATPEHFNKVVKVTLRRRETNWVGGLQDALGMASGINGLTQYVTLGDLAARGAFFPLAPDVSDEPKPQGYQIQIEEQGVRSQRSVESRSFSVHYYPTNSGGVLQTGESKSSVSTNGK